MNLRGALNKKYKVKLYHRKIVGMEENIKPWIQKIIFFARKYNIEPYVLAGLILQESSGNTYAIRCEPGFFKRYYPGLSRLVSKTSSKFDDNWIKYPDVFSASYGLCQVMYPIAIEDGLSLRYPTELCNPDVGIEAGCKHLRKHLDRVNNKIEMALLRYNGGGDPRYPAKVLEKGLMVKHLF
jgi:soluble lytic murein transglycosylase-like protein